MRAVVAPALGGSWEMREVPDPQPGPGEVLLEVEASGVCYSDVHLLHNPQYGGTFPRIPGHEVVGRVAGLGDGVDVALAGRRVGVPWAQRWCGVCRLCQSGGYAFCEQGAAATGATVDGGHAELMVAAAADVEPVPEEIPAEEAAPLLCAGYTVYTALREVDVQPGERVAVIGIGGLGHLALQYARALGAETVAVTSSREKVAAAEELGASVALVAEESAGALLARAGGADVVLATGNAVDSDVLEGLRIGGRLSLVGVSASPIDVTPLALVFKRARIVGSSPGSRALLRELLAFHAACGARTIVETYALDEAARALERVESGDVRFRAVIVPRRANGER